MRILQTISLSAATVLLLMGPAYATDGLTYYYPDSLGSPLAAANTAGDVLWSRTYQPFGRFTERCYVDCPAGEQRGFTAHEYDSATALTYMQARYYDAAVGRFLSVDPVAPAADEPASGNRYAYARNNPFRYIDPNGEDPYLVSRELDFLSIYSHNFVVSNADFPGDSKATVYSYGRTEGRKTGRVTSATTGFSAGTSDTDKTFWLSLSGDAASAATYSVKVPATDAEVDSYATSLIPNTTYSATTFLSGTTNSNSAASAVVNRAAGELVPVPDGDRSSPGAIDWDLIQFDLAPY